MEYWEITTNTLDVRVYYRLEQDLLANRSVVHLVGLDLRTRNGGNRGSLWAVGNIYLNGIQAARMYVTSMVSCSVDLSGTYSGFREGAWTGFEAGNLTFPHGDDGRLQLTLRLDLNFTNTGGVWQFSEPYTGTVEVPRIPRVSEITAQPVILGQPMEIRLTRAAEDFRDTVEWRCGSESGVLLQRSVEPGITWTPPEALASQAPNAERVPLVLRVTTFLGDTEVGCRELPLPCPIPETLVPTAEIQLSDAMGYAPRFGGYWQDQSQLRVQTRAAGSYGSSITSIAVTCCGITGRGEDVVFALPDMGTVQVQVRVTDSRGRSCMECTSFQVLPYHRPEVTILEAGRCDENGNAQADGLYARIRFRASCTDVINGTVTYRAIRKVHNGTASAQVVLTEYADLVTVADGIVILPAGAETSYDCTIQAEDCFGAVESLPVLVGVAFALLDLSRSTKAVGIGMRARAPGKLSIGLDTDLDEHRITNLQDPAADQDAATKAYVDARIRALAEQLGVTLPEYEN